MREHYVIVHDTLIFESTNPKLVRSVRAEIERIKRGKSWSDCSGHPTKIVDGLPKSAEDLTVFVCGAYSGAHIDQPFWCVDNQLEAIVQAGYKAELYWPAILKVDYDKREN